MLSYVPSIPTLLRGFGIFKYFIYLFMIGIDRERERQTQAEGEAGSMPGAKRGTRSRDSRIARPGQRQVPNHCATQGSLCVCFYASNTLF